MKKIFTYICLSILTIGIANAQTPEEKGLAIALGILRPAGNLSDLVETHGGSPRTTERKLGECEVRLGFDIRSYNQRSQRAQCEKKKNT